jgi:putative PIN family toxin of toxin-antitoxin system
MRNTILIIDANLWISYIFGKVVRQSLNRILSDPNINLITDQLSLDEVKSVLSRPKFKKYINSEQIEDLLSLIKERSILLQATSIVEICRDPKDNYLLALAKDGNADFLISGDEDLLILKQFEGTKIVLISDFMKSHFED